MYADIEKDIKTDFPSLLHPDSNVTIQLQRTKEDLELVSYALSHDLKSPLRSITAVCEAMNKAAEASTDKPFQEQIQKILHESSRMKELMQGMLDYLNLETYSPSKSVIDGNEIIENALTILRDSINNTGAKITIEKIPQLYGHRGRYTRLFVYLIDNAIKFAKPHVPEIQVSVHSASSSDYAEFHISDNGIGIEEEYSDVIFQLFQRLHTSGEFPGNGIGLALCKKIVESAGGKLWLDTSSKTGSVFCFTLPITDVNG